jgi:hypothetical protein
MGSGSPLKGRCTKACRGFKRPSIEQGWEDPSGWKGLASRKKGGFYAALHHNMKRNLELPDALAAGFAGFPLPNVG